jgi:DNA-binding winged helix-turn-helix (wHTH) protein
MVCTVPNTQGPPAYKARPFGPGRNADIVSASMKAFDPFRLDTVNQCLWQSSDGNESRILLKPKAFGILRYLVDNAGRLVTQGELLDAVWPGTYVQPEVLKRHIVDIRSALGDNPRRPTYIETRPWLGYQFITTVRDGVSGLPLNKGIQMLGKLSGRDQALGDLHIHLRKALEGQRQIVLVGGAPGIGKSELVENFCRWVSTGLSIRIAAGRHSKESGLQPFEPWVEALTALFHESGTGTYAARVLESHAPTWLNQFPRIANREPGASAPQGINADIGGKMLRELSSALEALSSTIPLLIVLEDLHRADTWALDGVLEMAKGHHFAKLIVVGTCQPHSVTHTQHSLWNTEVKTKIERYVMQSPWSRCETWT